MLTGGKTADEWRGVRALEHLREEGRRRLDVRGPTEPAGVTGIHVHVHADRGELLERVRDASLVRRLGVSALLDVQVGDQVGEGVGLDDGHNADVGVLLDLRDDLVDVVLVVGLTVVGDAELSVGRLGRTVTVGQVVDDDLDELLVSGALLDRVRIGEVRAEIGDLGDGVEPGECRDVGNARSLAGEAGVGDGLGSCGDLGSVVRAQVDL